MRYVKKFFSLTAYDRLLKLCLRVLFIAFGASMHVHAGETDLTSIFSNASDTSSIVSYTVIGFENSEQLSNLAPAEIVRRSTQNTEPLFYHVYNNHLLNVNAFIKDSDGNITTQTLSVSWSCWDDSTTVTNTTVCGDYLETGIIQLPNDSYQWGEGVLSALSLPVRVFDPTESIEIVELEDVWNEFDTAFSLEQNGSIENLLSTAPLQTAWPCYDAAGNEYLCSVVYNTEDVREDTVGIYYITATFDAPLNCRFSDSLTIPSHSLPVTVQAPGQPRLDLSYLSPNYEFILFPWITSDINLGAVEVWLSENDGEWRTLQPDDEVYIYPSELSLYAWYLNEGSSYRIQVKYEGGQTGIASFTYAWDMLSDMEYIEGDRDGGDTNGNPPNDGGGTNGNPPDNSEEGDSDEEDSDEEDSVTAEDSTPQEDTSPEDGSAAQGSSATQGASAAQEGSAAQDNDSKPGDESSDTIQIENVPSDSVERETPYLLGSELNRMIQATGTTRFSAEAIMLNIPADTIAALGINDTDRFLVTILPVENNGFSVDILKNGNAVTTVSSMQISLPYQLTENTTPVLSNGEGSIIADGIYDADTKLVTFTINETGTFYVQYKEVPMQDTFVGNTLTVTEISAADKDNDHSVFVVIVATAVITCSAVFAISIHRKKRRT